MRQLSRTITLQFDSCTKTDLSSRDPQAMVTLVSVDGEEFPVHKEVACFYSATFAKRLEHSQRIVIGAENQVTRRLVQWLYTQKVILHVTHAEKCYEYCYASRASSDEANYEAMELVKLWLIAEELSIPTLQNLVIEKIDHLFNNHFDGRFLDFIDIAYYCLSSSSLLWEYLVAFCAHNYVKTGLERKESFHDSEYIVAVLRYACLNLGERKQLDLSDYFEKV